MAELSLYFFLFFLIFLINMVPAFMPPTWVVIAIYYTHYHLEFIPTVILAVIAATSGRIMLYLISKHFLKKYFPNSFRKNYQSLGHFLNTHQKLTAPLVIAYAFSPIPSNDLFIIAGLSNANIKLIAVSFACGRLLSYTFWVGTSTFLASRLENTLHISFTGQKAYIGIIFTIMILFIVGKINWGKVLKKVKI